MYIYSSELSAHISITAFLDDSERLLGFVQDVSSSVDFSPLQLAVKYKIAIISSMMPKYQVAGLFLSNCVAIEINELSTKQLGSSISQILKLWMLEFCTENIECKKKEARAHPKLLSI